MTDPKEVLEYLESEKEKKEVEQRKMRANIWVIYTDIIGTRKTKPFSTIEGAERWIKRTGNTIIAITRVVNLVKEGFCL